MIVLYISIYFIIGLFFSYLHLKLIYDYFEYNDDDFSTIILLWPIYLIILIFIIIKGFLIQFKDKS